MLLLRLRNVFPSWKSTINLSRLWRALAKAKRRCGGTWNTSDSFMICDSHHISGLQLLITTSRRDAVLLREWDLENTLIFLQVSEAGFARAHGIYYRVVAWMSSLHLRLNGWTWVDLRFAHLILYIYFCSLLCSALFFRRAETSCSCCTECSGKCKHTQDHSQPDTTCNFSAVKVNLKEAFPSHLQHEKHVARESNRSVLISRRRTQTTAMSTTKTQLINESVSFR